MNPPLSKHGKGAEIGRSDDRHATRENKIRINLEPKVAQDWSGKPQMFQATKLAPSQPFKTL